MKMTNVQIDYTPDTCPVCSGPMQWRHNRVSGNRFMGCLAWPGCRGTRTEDGTSSVISANRQNRMWAMLKAAILRSSDECLTFSHADLEAAEEFDLHIDEVKEEKAYVLTVRKKV